ncbi:hypothetical protein B0A50_02339 [Salinomyces thailandicus]|uniref:Mitochondrial fission process protein 1 n=1 Tax=Salinomyces thailandicus TaxID=706561 RepID=A0A4U0U9Y7_9PEZI|nr:hypothetical protein B0A50_02339 [Salinomyces thailandica]
MAQDSPTPPAPIPPAAAPQNQSSAATSTTESTDTPLRYAAYTSRLRTLLLSAHRYIAYTSDIGESFRPIAHPWLVRGAYGISWAYLIGDVSWEGYKAYGRNEQVKGTGTKVGEDGKMVVAGRVPPIEHWSTVMAQRAIFQSIASMGLPAFTVHSIVRYSGQALKNNKNVRIRTWGPIGLGLAVVPALPYVFDEPVEKATEWVFEKGFEAVGGPAAVGHGHAVGGGKVKEVPSGKEKEKEL